MVDSARGTSATAAGSAPVPSVPSHSPTAPSPADGPATGGPLEVSAVELLEALPDPTFVVDLDDNDDAEGWHVVWTSSRLPAAVGYTAQELHASAPLLFAADSGSWAALQRALRAGLPLAVVRPVRRRDGSTYRATVTFTPLPGAAAGRRRWLVTLRDAKQELASAAVAEERTATEERARRGLSLVARVSDILADVESSSTLADIAALLVRRAVPWAAFYADGTRIQEITDLGGLPHHGRDLRRVARMNAGRDDPVLDLLLEPRMQTVVVDRESAPERGTLTAELVDAVAENPAAPTDGPLWLLPILGRQEVLGILAARPPERSATDNGRTMTSAELTTVLELVARRVGMAMDNLQLYEREHRLAEALQRAMLPEQSVVEGVDVWTYYSPNSEHAQVGGDWYDVLDMGGRNVGIVVGDVVGHDVEAAAAMGQLRSVVRAYAAEFVEPGLVLGRVDRLAASMRIARPASLVYAALEPHEDSATWTLSYSRAGHLPPVLVRGSEVRQLEDANGSLIGFGERPRRTGHAEIHPGDVLIFYTDGLVERRDRAMRDGVDALVSVAGRIDAPDAAGVGEELLQRLAGAPEDDIAVVVVRIPSTDSDASHGWSSPRQRRWQMPMDPQTIARSRHALLRACEAWGIEETAAAELVVSELVANAVMHGWGRVDLRLQDTGDGLRIEVEDANPAPPVLREGRASRVGGFGLHIIARLADWGWRPSPAGKVVWARVRGNKPWEKSD